MTWTQERREAQSKRMREHMAKNPPRKTLAQLKAEAGCFIPVPVEDKRLIRKLAEVRDELREQLAVEQTAWEERKADLLRQIANLSNQKLADKFECSLGQVRTIIQCAAGQSL